MGYSALTNVAIMSPNHSGSRYNSISKITIIIWLVIFLSMTCGNVFLNPIDKRHLTTESVQMDVLLAMSMKKIIRGHPLTGITMIVQSLSKWQIARLVAIGQSVKQHTLL